MSWRGSASWLCPLGFALYVAGGGQSAMREGLPTGGGHRRQRAGAKDVNEGARAGSTPQRHVARCRGRNRHDERADKMGRWGGYEGNGNRINTTSVVRGERRQGRDAKKQPETMGTTEGHEEYGDKIGTTGAHEEKADMIGTTEGGPDGMEFLRCSAFGELSLRDKKPGWRGLARWLLSAGVSGGERRYGSSVAPPTQEHRANRPIPLSGGHLAAGPTAKEFDSVEPARCIVIPFSARSLPSAASVRHPIPVAIRFLPSVPTARPLLLGALISAWRPRECGLLCETSGISAR